ncbi:MAG: hypothetical protein H6863_05565, partial [Rhodospirillales bacterium]|nr:hypothetical protein [Rhodospirillales bacterium]
LGVRLSGRPVPSMPLPGEWPDLEMALETLKTSGFPDLAAPMMQLIPSARTPAQIPPALLLFFMAVKGGDLSGWIGERPLDALKRLGKTDLINRLSSDFSTLSRLSSDTFGQDWRGMLFPFSGDLSLQMIAVFYKQDEHASQDHPGKKQTRFIFDMDLSRMGSVQIDGLFNSFEQVPRLEVMLRTEAPLSDGMKKMLRHSYAQAVKAVGISGELSFQGAAENFVTILEREEKVELTT